MSYKYIAELSPKSGYAEQFKKLKAEIRQLSCKLDRFVVLDDQVEIARVRKEIAGKMFLIQSISK